MSTAQLDRSPGGGFTAAEIVAMAGKGELRVPTFQRQYVWDAKDVRNLFDSLLRRFPVGTLLLWERHADAAEVSLGPIRLTAPENSRALWVVDGQQRVTSLFGALAPGFGGIDDRFEVYFDLATRRFITGRRGYTPPRAVPVREALDSKSLQGWNRRHADELDDDDFDLADALVAALRDYKIPAYIVTGDDQNLLREVFDRVNSAGRPISRAQIFHALFASEGEPGSPGQVADNLSALGFGTFTEDRVVQSVLAIRGGDVQRDLHGEFDAEETAAQWYDNAELALTRAIEFLRSEGVPHLQLLPNTLAIPALAAFFHLHPEPEPWTRRLLSRWLWRGWVHGFGREGGQTPVLRRAIQSINPVRRDPGQAPSEYEAVRSLLEFTPDRAAPDLGRAGFNPKFGNARLLLLALSSLGPRDAEGQVIDLAAAFEERGSAAVGQLAPGSRTDAAVRALWDDRVSFDPHALPREVLDSHLVSPEAAHALSNGAVETFLGRRGADLAELARRFLTVRLDPEATTRPPIRELLERGADGGTEP